MIKISAKDTMALREATGAGLMDCKKALEEAEGDKEKAIQILRQKGIATAAKKSIRKADQGLIASYIHMDKIGVLIEINCETDFVAKTDEFRSLAKDIAMHIAAANPTYLSREELPDAVIEKEKEIYAAQMPDKPDRVKEKIIEGKLEKFYSDVCLLEQIFIKDPNHKLKISDLLTNLVAKIGENIVIRRFARFQIGQ
jgi:elongation factor Ts